MDINKNTTFSNLRQVRSALRQAHQTLYKSYRMLSTPKTPWEQWLWDHYYALDGALRGAGKDLRYFLRSSPACTALFSILWAHFRTEPLAQDSLERLLEQFAQTAQLDELAFDFLRLGLQCSLLLYAGESCESHDETLLSSAVQGLGALSGFDYDALITKRSLTEQILRQDPAGVYPRMTEKSRSAYRHAAGRIAARCGLSEHRVAQDVLECAQKGETENERHVGLYLMNHDPNRTKAARRKYGFLLMAALLPCLLSILFAVLGNSFWLGVLLFIPLGELMQFVLRFWAVRALPERVLPKVELPPEAERPVVVAAIVSIMPEPDELGAMRGRLERLYHSNPGENMIYCLLLDPPEARKPWFPQDEQRLEAVKGLIRALNGQYGEHFLLVARRRVWCKTRDKYCAWERKRGAIVELIRQARKKETTECCVEGCRTRLERAEYLLVLDGDSEAGFDAVNHLLRAAMHPLNRAQVAHGRVRSGYGIFCPAVMPRRGKTLFSLLMNGYCGHSAYAQENGTFAWKLFAQTAFTGKGLLHMDTFDEVLSRKIPKEAVLSHDVLEGGYLRGAFVCEAVVTEETPEYANAYFARLHRWVRGDWQNIPFLLRSAEQKLGGVGKLFVLENLRRSLVAPTLLLCVLFGVFGNQFIIYMVSILTICLPLLQEFYRAFLAMGTQSFSQGPARFSLALGRVGWAFSALVAQATASIDAIIMSLWRLKSRKNLLEWTTAARSATEKKKWKHAFLPMLLGGLLFFAPSWAAKFFGVCFFVYPFAARATARKMQQSKSLPNRMQREQILDWCAHMLAYYETYANKRNHWLPPDNVQFSPVEAVAQRTSPTNIGMMLLSYLAARDMGFLDSAALCVRLMRVMDTLDKLEKYQGNLYNWYATDDLRRLPPDFVSSVDSGNFLCALVALREGIREYSAEEPKLTPVGKRIEAILQETDFSIFYNKQRELLSIGVDDNGKAKDSHYDFLMSEARTASYYAIASRQVPPEHWGALNRTLSRWRGRCGPISWTGTFFEYFMPHLLLPVYPHTILWEGLGYALFCQKGAAKKQPWGISESAYISFDDELRYQYKAHGVEPLAVERRKEAVVSPYSSFLALPFDLDGAMENLHRLEALGAVGQYGFFEAIDLTPGRCKNGCGVIRSYMAHHIGMSMIACANTLFDRVMQKRFMRNPAMGAARMLLQEKMPEERSVEALTGKPSKRGAPASPVTVHREAPDAAAPACTMLSNESLTYFATDGGAGVLRWGNTDVTRKTDDLLTNSQGIFVVAHAGGETLTATAAPFYSGQTHSCDFLENAVVYQAQSKQISLRQCISLEKGFPALRCSVTLESTQPGKLVAELLFYFEPILANWDSYAAHPAFSKLFLVGGREESTDSILFSRRMRDGNEGLWLCVGFEKPEAYQFTLKREEATPYAAGMSHLLRPESIAMQGGTATPDGCCALRLAKVTSSKNQNEVTLLLCCGKSKEEACNTLAALRTQKSVPSTAPLANDSTAARLGMRLLPRLLFQPLLEETRKEALAENTRGRDGLWELGISGQHPLVLYRWNERPDRVLLDGYLRFWRLMKLHSVPFDFCVIDLPEEEPLPKGVHRFVDLRPDSLCVLGAVARAVLSSEEGLAEQTRAVPFCPIEKSTLEAQSLAQEEGFHVVGGLFTQRRFFVERVTPLPFSHVLANSNFGCLLQDASLGYSWFQNAHECRISPWKNDIATGCNGEKMTLKINDTFYDLCCGARASFSAQDARYEGRAGTIRTTLEVRVDAAAAIKYLDVTLENTGDCEQAILCAYSLEPVLDVEPSQNVQMRFEQYKGCLLMHQAWQREIPCFAGVRVPGEHPSFMTERAAFYAGDWQAQPLGFCNDPIAAVLVRKTVAPGSQQTIHFLLGAAEEREPLLTLLETPQPLCKARDCLRMDTPDEPLNRFMETFAFHQVLAGRIHGRTGFYQSSGAYGFRDQLQDAGACLWLDPEITKEQILRCCRAQFSEGDVLHWWHPLKNGMKGVRTRCSDDLLWLALTAVQYYHATGDKALLETAVPYCKGALLQPDEQERYQSVETDPCSESVYRHCARALERAWSIGEHGLPHIGAGDWNDGFSQVGAQGKGESVWLAMFFAMVSDEFAPIAMMMGERLFAEKCMQRAALLRRAVDETCWEGKWYLRAFYDDGTPLGGLQNDECRIDLLSQAFSVLCGMPDKTRVKSALDEAMVRLVDFRHGIIRLFTPPFDTTEKNPGYIKAYPTGIRENGGQYTHAALWLAIALLRAGRIEEGWALIDMINPAARCTVAEMALAMKTEPYYLPADIYSHSGCYGHGGWSIYTGAAGWFCRAVLGELLGLRFWHGALQITPGVPKRWNRFSLELTIGTTRLKIGAQRTGEAALRVDGRAAQSVPLDGGVHEVSVDF